MAADQEYTIACDDLRIVFKRRGDRWGHRFELRRADGSFAELCASAESSPSDAPSSPPIQDLQYHEHEGTPSLLGVGMSGRNHWSITCSGRRSPQGEGEVVVEVACRVKGASSVLASTYDLGPNVRLESCTTGEIELVVDARPIHICPRYVTLAVTKDGFALTARSSEQSGVPRTVQWSYSIKSRNPTSGQPQTS